MDSSSEREKLDGKTPDTPESLALWVWDKFVGCPITESYDAMYLLLLERLKFMHRATFTAGLRECMRQMTESKEARAALDSSGVREQQIATVLQDALIFIDYLCEISTLRSQQVKLMAGYQNIEAALAHSKEGK